MKTYSNSSNARRAATSLAKQHDNLKVETPVKGPDGWFAAVSVTTGTAPASVKTAAKVIGDEVEPAPVKKAAPKARKAEARKPKSRVKEGTSKAQQAFDLMSRKGGVTSGELLDRFNWHGPTLRGFISLENSTEKKIRKDGKVVKVVKKESRGIKTRRVDGVTTYYIE